MPYVPVIPPVWYPIRQGLNDILSALFASFIANVPSGVLRKYWSEVPSALDGEHPFVYQGEIHEQRDYSGSVPEIGGSLIRTLFTGSLGYVDVFADPEETNTRQNTFADYVRMFFDYNGHPVFTLSNGASVNAILKQTGLIDGPTELTQGSAHFTDMRIEFTMSIMTGDPSA